LKAQDTLVAQLEEPEREEERPEEEAERALEPVEAKPETPQPMTPAEEVMSKHSASDIQAVRNGACSVDPKLEEAIRVNDTFNKIKSGGTFPYAKDNTVFNNNEGRLPSQSPGYYKEFTVPPASGSGRGTMRLVTGAGGEIYQTDDHYRTFVKIAGP
jgi:guanyl-specific ribonuclease Sa